MFECEIHSIVQIVVPSPYLKWAFIWGKRLYFIPNNHIVIAILKYWLYSILNHGADNITILPQWEYLPSIIKITVLQLIKVFVRAFAGSFIHQMSFGYKCTLASKIEILVIIFKTLVSAIDDLSVIIVLCSVEALTRLVMYKLKSNLFNTSVISESESVCDMPMGWPISVIAAFNLYDIRVISWP